MSKIIEKILIDDSARSTQSVEKVALNTTEFGPWGSDE
jgi:hypothetical protein